MGNWNPIARTAFRMLNLSRKRMCLQEVVGAEAGAGVVVAEAEAEVKADDVWIPASLKMHDCVHHAPCALH